ncbi:MAG: asparagine synthase (glutamine-hydrolyzing) [Proteobacteria bacterium]|nr:asparagine synthase (glutamine-hydrolyzing) [Pseudomonadota bacterium]
MCGIFASMTHNSISPKAINQALKTLNHRGPDASGIWSSADKRWTLGHTRLSIIGLDNGAQPISSSDGCVHTVVNGEFYGYRKIRQELQAGGCRFSTDSDSEVALHLYNERGMQAAAELRGEFAVIIADERARMMIAIRDRFGIKPLYYAAVNGDIFFASEIKALLALGVPAVWDLEGALGGMSGPHEKTEFAGISAVPPGCYAIAKDGEVRIYAYWDWEIPTAMELREDVRNETEIVADFRQILQESIQQRLVADVEVACYLSGGIDSCAVLGMAQQSMKSPLRAFTLTFGDPLYDEAAIAKKQAEFVGSSYHPVPITGREIADAYPDAVWHAETQMFNGHGVAKYLLSKAVQEAGIKVVFTGEGADEMLGGYSYFRVDSVQHNPSLSAAQKASLIDEIFGANEATRAIMLPEQADTPELKAVRGRLGWLPAAINSWTAMSNDLRPFFRDDYAAHIGSYSPMLASLDRLPLAQRAAGRDHLNQSLYINAKTSLPNFILTYLGDRMEMAHSVEGRVPFLDHRLAEVAARVPVDMKVKGIREKHILREATKDVLIDEVYNRQKHPFTTPPTRDKNDPMHTFYRDTFASQAAKDQPIYDMKKVRAAADKLLDGPTDERIAAEGLLQRIASVTLMQEKFGMT